MGGTFIILCHFLHSLTCDVVIVSAWQIKNCRDLDVLASGRNPGSSLCLLVWKPGDWLPNTNFIPAMTDRCSAQCSQSFTRKWCMLLFLVQINTMHALCSAVYFWRSQRSSVRVCSGSQAVILAGDFLFWMNIWEGKTLNFSASNVSTEGRVKPCWCSEHKHDMRDWMNVSSQSPRWVCEAAADLGCRRSGRENQAETVWWFRWKLWVTKPKNSLFFSASREHVVKI